MSDLATPFDDLFRGALELPRTFLRSDGGAPGVLLLRPLRATLAEVS